MAGSHIQTVAPLVILEQLFVVIELYTKLSNQHLANCHIFDILLVHILHIVIAAALKQNRKF